VTEHASLTGQPVVTVRCASRLTDTVIGTTDTRQNRESLTALSIPPKSSPYLGAIAMLMYYGRGDGGRYQKSVGPVQAAGSTVHKHHSPNSPIVRRLGCPPNTK